MRTISAAIKITLNARIHKQKLRRKRKSKNYDKASLICQKNQQITLWLNRKKNTLDVPKITFVPDEKVQMTFSFDVNFKTVFTIIIRNIIIAVTRGRLIDS